MKSMWLDWPEWKRKKVRNLLPTIANGADLTHEMIEAAVHEVDSRCDIEDDDWHHLITEVAAEYHRNGAMD